MREIKKGSVDQSVVIRIVDATDGTPELAVEHDTAGIDLWYRREGGLRVAIAEAALAALDSGHADGGIEHIGDGYYRLDLPDAAVGAGANGVAIGGAVTGMVVIGTYVHLTDYDPQDAVRLGLSALPNAAADAPGGLPISDAGALDLDARLDAAVSSRASQASVNTIDDLLDTEVAQLLADTAALLGRLTAARAGYLDNLNIGGNVASSAEATAIQNNTRVVRVVPEVIERPDAGTVEYRIELFLYDETGGMEAPDAAPTIALVNQAGVDRSARLDNVNMALVEAGRYRAIYTAGVGDALEQLVWTFSVTEGGATRKYGNQSVIVDTTAVDFTAADRAKLDTLHDVRLTAGRAANLDNLAGGPAALQASVDELEGRLTAGRAANLDLLADAAVGLAAIEALVDELESRLTEGRAALLDSIGTLTVAERAAVADKFLGRSIAGGADGGRTVTSAMRRIRNKNAIVAGVLTTFQEDDVTPDHTAQVTTAPGDPIASVDPN